MIRLLHSERTEAAPPRVAHIVKEKKLHLFCAMGIRQRENVEQMLNVR